jgi:hypothetical protein
VGVGEFDIIEVVAEITEKDIEARLKRQFDNEKTALSVISVSGGENK